MRRLAAVTARPVLLQAMPLRAMGHRTGLATATAVRLSWLNLGKDGAAAEGQKGPSADGTAAVDTNAPEGTAQVAGDAAVGGSAQQEQQQKPLWDDCDTVEDIIEEEKFGAPLHSSAAAEAYAAGAVPPSAAAATESGQDEDPNKFNDGTPLPSEADAVDAAIAAEKAIADKAPGAAAAAAAADADAEAAKKVAAEFSGKMPFEIPQHMIDNHTAVAKRALLLGTVLAVALVTACTALLMRAFGFASLSDILAHIGGKDERHLQDLRDRGEEVIVYSLDVTDERMAQQAVEVWDAVQKLAEDEVARDEAGAGSAEAPAPQRQ